LRDSDRPAVLAHLRFAGDQASFAGLNLAQRFQRIHDTHLWGAAASVSGLGSETDATETLRAQLPRLLAKLKATSLLDAPCGDAGWINRAGLGVRVVGVDIVPALIEGLKARAAAVPDAMQRATLLRRAGTQPRQQHVDPGSAAHHAAKCDVLRSIRGTHCYPTSTTTRPAAVLSFSA